MHLGVARGRGDTGHHCAEVAHDIHEPLAQGAKNTICVRLNAPAWQSGTVPPAGRTSFETMASWSVDELAHFIEEQDAEALAGMLRNQSVNGADFQTFRTHEELAADMRLTPFAAKKLLRLRDAFLVRP